jgi:hypothetical protein
MKTFWPLSLYTEPSRVARVVIRNAFEPASGSVIAKQKRLLPDAMSGRKRFFTSSLALRTMQAVSMAVTTISALPRPRAPISSTASAMGRSPMPFPPYSSGTRQPMIPISAMASHSSRGNFFSLKISRCSCSRRGSKRPSTSATVCLSIRCSSVSEVSIMSPAA